MRSARSEVSAGCLSSRRRTCSRCLRARQRHSQAGPLAAAAAPGKEIDVRRLTSLVLAALALLAVTSRAAEPLPGQIIYSVRGERDRFRLHVMNADGTGD